MERGRVLGSPALLYKGEATPHPSPIPSGCVVEYRRVSKSHRPRYSPSLWLVVALALHIVEDPLAVLLLFLLDVVERLAYICVGHLENGGVVRG